MNLIEAVATRQTRLGCRSKAILLNQQLVLGALKGNCISHHELAATTSLGNVTPHYDDLSQASVLLGQPVLAPT